MNEHILLVMKYLKDPESVSQEELKKNAAAYAAYAAYAAAYYVDKYFYRTGENKKEYENALNKKESNVSDFGAEKDIHTKTIIKGGNTNIGGELFSLGDVFGNCPATIEMFFAEYINKELTNDGLYDVVAEFVQAEMEK